MANVTGSSHRLHTPRDGDPARPSRVGRGLSSFSVGPRCHHQDMEPDTTTRISLIGTTERLTSLIARGETDQAAAVDELRRIAGKNTHLLSDAAGYFDGAGLWNGPDCKALLVAAGANNQERIEAAVEEVRANRAKFGRGQTAQDQWQR